MRGKVIAALSGGVDSSVAAVLAQQAGYEVIGVTLQLKHPNPDFSASQSCAAKNDEAVIDAICAKLGIEHHYLEFYPEFEQEVLRPAAQEYARGRTPNPCCECNRQIKFAKLVEFARTIGAVKVLTGHYAKLSSRDGIFELRRGDDFKKDQSYFLYRLNQEILSMVEFPVGNMTKEEVRKIAAQNGLVTSEKPDSQDACFQVPGESFGETLLRLENLPPQPGLFRYQGKIVGRHNGIHKFTIGQRKGLNVALGVPAYIAEIDPKSGDIRLETEQEKLLTTRFTVERLVWQAGKAPNLTQNMEVQIRYLAKAVPCKVELNRENEATVIPQSPLWAVTPGQAAVFYNQDLLLGGGVINQAEKPG